MHESPRSAGCATPDEANHPPRSVETLILVLAAFAGSYREIHVAGCGFELIMSSRLCEIAFRLGRFAEAVSAQMVRGSAAPKTN